MARKSKLTKIFQHYHDQSLTFIVIKL